MKFPSSTAISVQLAARASSPSSAAATAAQVNETATSRAHSSYLASTRYHRAAVDGFVDMLCDARKRQTNEANDVGLTPVHLAALSGQLEALRILVGRGGKPEKCSALDGSTALHLAACRNHLNCVSFLVNFGVNVWLLDDNLHTAKDVATMHNAAEVLDFLDAVIARQSAVNTKAVQKAKQKASQLLEKRQRGLRKLQMRAIKSAERDEKYLVKLSASRKLLKGAHSISDIQLVGRVDYSPKIFARAAKQQAVPTSLQLQQQALDCGKLQAQRKSCSSSFASSSATLATHSSLASSVASSFVANYKQFDAPSSSGNSPSSPNSSCTSDELKQVANNQTSLSSTSSSSSFASPTSTASSLSVATKLRELGGVSRRLRMRRLLTAGKQQAAPPTSRRSPVPRSTPICNVRANIRCAPNKQQELATEALEHLGGSSQVPKPPPLPGLASPLSGCRATMPPEPPPLPQRVRPNKLLRAVSEPDFINAQANEDCGDESEADEADENCKLEARSSLEQDCANEPHLVNERLCGEAGAEEPLDECSNQNSACNADAEQSECSKSDQNKVNSTSNFRESQQSALQDNEQEAEFAKREMLNKCLSQLKLTKQVISSLSANQTHLVTNSRAQQQTTSELAPNSLSSNANNAQATRVFFSNSDELLKHQISVGKLPIKPSLIKQLNNIHAKNLRNISAHKGCVEAPRSFPPSDLFNNNQNNTKLVSSSASSSSAPLANSKRPVATGSERKLAAVFEGESIGSAGSLADTRSTTSSSPVSDDSCGGGSGFVQQSCHSSSQCSSQIMSHLMQEVQEFSGNLCEQSNELDTFLASNNLLELRETFANERIDLEALLLLDDDDFRSLGVLLGPRRKLSKAIVAERKRQATQQDCNNNRAKHSNKVPRGGNSGSNSCSSYMFCCPNSDAQHTNKQLTNASNQDNTAL